jgi:hypothetical protein
VHIPRSIDRERLPVTSSELAKSTTIQAALLKQQLDHSDEFGFVTPLEFLFEIVGLFCHTSIFPLF